MLKEVDWNSIVYSNIEEYAKDLSITLNIRRSIIDNLSYTHHKIITNLIIQDRKAFR